MLRSIPYSGIGDADDRFLVLRLISTSTGQDAVLGSVEYLSYTLYHLLASTKARQVLHRKAYIRLKGPGPSCILAISSLASDARHTFRLFSLIRLLGLGLGINQDPQDRSIRILAFLQVFTLALYQALENVSFMAVKGVISKHFIEKFGGIGKWYLWSARFLLGNIVLQFFSLGRGCSSTRRVGDGKPDSREMSKPSECPIEDQIHKNKQDSERRLQNREWWKGLTTNTIWTPLCIHWSMDGGIGIPANLVGTMSFLAGVWGLHDLWKQTGEM